jgi:hypothetical protein
VLQPIQLNVTKHCASIFCLVRVPMIPVIQHKELDINNPERVKNPLCAACTSTCVRPVSTIHIEGILTKLERPIRIVGPEVVVVPDPLAWRARHQGSDLRNVACFPVVSRHSPSHRLTISLVVRRTAWHVIDVTDKQECGGTVLNRFFENGLQRLSRRVQTRPKCNHKLRYTLRISTGRFCWHRQKRLRWQQPDHTTVNPDFISERVNERPAP